MIGICTNATSANHSISQNTIFNLSNTNATAATVVTGAAVADEQDPNRSSAGGSANRDFDRGDARGVSVGVFDGVTGFCLSGLACNWCERHHSAAFVQLKGAFSS